MQKSSENNASVELSEAKPLETSANTEQILNQNQSNEAIKKV